MVRIMSHREEIRAACERSLYTFIQEFWSILEPAQPFVGGWALQAWCFHLEAVTSGRIQYLLGTVPPGMMKSLSTSVFWPAWEWGPKRLASMRFLTSSYEAKLAERDNAKMRRLVESEKFRALWPEVQFAKDQNAKTKFENTKRGGRECRAFKSMTGGRGDRVIIDDPHTVNTAESDVERAATVTTFREAIPDRLNDMSRSAIVVIMQRLHEDDVAGTIIKLRLPYVHLNLPMEYDPARKCRTFDRHGRLLFEDPRTYDGELLFPERFPRSTIEGLKESKGSYAYAGQYQQRPTPREGGLFKRAYFAGKIVARNAVPAGLHLRVRAWDFASRKATPGRPPDASSGVLMGRHGNDYYVFNSRRLMDTPGVVEDTVMLSAETDPEGTIIRIPQDPGQAGVAQAERYIKMLSGYSVVTKPVTGAKETRATPLATQAEHGHVYLVNGGPVDEGLDPWIEPFIDELCGFPNGPDDQVDAAADAFNELALGFAGKFEVLSGGKRESAASAHRDSRYNFGDNEPVQSGRGFGSASAQRYGV
jgi:predicted phage terminase large subunit-like protein